jgi:hypothetical protein
VSCGEPFLVPRLYDQIVQRLVTEHEFCHLYVKGVLCAFRHQLWCREVYFYDERVRLDELVRVRRGQILQSASFVTVRIFDIDLRDFPLHFNVDVFVVHVSLCLLGWQVLRDQSFCAFVSTVPICAAFRQTDVLVELHIEEAFVVGSADRDCDFRPCDFYHVLIVDFVLVQSVDTLSYCDHCDLYFVLLA